MHASSTHVMSMLWNVNNPVGSMGRYVLSNFVLNHSRKNVEDLEFKREKHYTNFGMN